MLTQFLNKILLPLGSFLNKGNFSAQLKEWQHYDCMSEIELLKLQEDRVSSMLKQAAENVPYYQSLSLSEGASLQQFPILTKTILRERQDELIAKGYRKNDMDAHHSSGSSGIQSFTYMPKEHTFYLRALQTHMWNWGGYQAGERLIQTGISPNRGFIKSLKDFFFRVTYLEAFALKKDTMRKSLAGISHSSKKHLAGYPSALNEIAKLAIEEGLESKFNSVICYGDKLFDHHRENFKEAFKNPEVVNTYGCAEGLLMACQTDLNYYYILAPHVKIEIVNDQGDLLPDGEMGHILVTGLTNYGMPLIRYRLGDLGILLPKDQYPDNRRFQYPLLQTVIGRETDVIKTPTGDTLVVHSFTGILEYFTSIKQYKVIQTAADKISIQYTTDLKTKLSEEDKIELLQQLNLLTGNSMEYALKLVDQVSASPSGKPQIIEIKEF